MRVDESAKELSDPPSGFFMQNKLLWLFIRIVGQEAGVMGEKW